MSSSPIDETRDHRAWQFQAESTIAYSAMYDRPISDATSINVIAIADSGLVH